MLANGYIIQLSIAAAEKLQVHSGTRYSVFLSFDTWGWGRGEKKKEK